LSPYVGQFVELNWSATTEVDNGWTAIVPQVVVAPGATTQTVNNIASATGGVYLTPQYWTAGGSPGVAIDSASPTGYSSGFTGAASFSLLGWRGDSNLKGGHLYPAVNSIVDWLVQAPPVITDTLGATQNAGDSTITVSTPQSAWGTTGCLIVDQEIECYTGSAAVGTTTYAVSRAQYGTIAQTHANSTPYYSTATAELFVSCNSTNYLDYHTVFTPLWQFQSTPVALQNCSGYSTQFGVQFMNGPTGQTAKMGAIDIIPQTTLTTPSAAYQIPYSLPANPLGDLPYAFSGVVAPNITTTTKCFTQTGDGVHSAAPVWGVCLPLTGTSGSIGGSPLTAGTCATGTVSVTGATTSMGVVATPATYPGDAFTWSGYVSSSNTVTVRVCTNLAAGGTPTASVYNVRVIQ